MENLVEYKNRFDSLAAENEELRSQVFEVELKSGSEQRFQTLYESTRAELKTTKESLNSTELAYKKLQTDCKAHLGEIDRLSKSLYKKDALIKQLNLNLEKVRHSEVSSSHDSAILGDNFHYEERIRCLEQEIEDLKIENENYANNEIVRLEAALQQQKDQAAKHKQERGFFEERCALLEQQNSELKKRIENLKLGKVLLISSSYREPNQQKQVTR